MATKEIMKTDTNVEEKTLANQVLARVEALRASNALDIPKDYSPSNALKSAWLTLQTTKDKNNKPVLETCSQVSIANSLLDMVIQGLSPAKRQCYFIAWGDELSCFRSYHGTQAALKRLNGVTDVFAQVIYKDDVFEYELLDGNIQIVKHEQKLENIDGDKIVGAYCIIVKNGKKFTEIMTKKQIDVAWSKKRNAGNVQKEFPDEMAKRTVINRAAKRFVNTSDDSDILVESFNRSSESEYQNFEEASEQKTVAKHANREEIAIPVEIAEETVPAKESEPIADVEAAPAF